MRLFALLLLAFPVLAEETPPEIFEQVWVEAKERIHPESLVDEHFTDARYRALRRRAEQIESVYELTPIINGFLDELGVSHTRFYDDSAVDFYFFRSLFSTRDIDNPRVSHIGAHFALINEQYVVRETLSVYPAEAAGLLRGDVMLSVNGQPFHPYHSFNPSKGEVELTFSRNGELHSTRITAVHENPNRSLAKAIGNSARVTNYSGTRIGYLRLWSGTGAEHLEAFRKALQECLQDIDALILDLRGGFGGAWYEYIDPFFEDRSSYFGFSVTSREGVSDNDAEPQDNVSHFAGPMVVLIDEGTRSGKEGLAYQFKKSGRAKLVGQTTAGAFSAGRGLFNDSDKPYFLYLAVAEFRLDGNRIEGVGVSPDVVVDYPLDRTLLTEPQLSAAISLLLPENH